MSFEYGSFTYRIEAPFDREGECESGKSYEQQENKILLLSDPENQRYTDLFQGFFHYLERWETVLSANKYLVGYEEDTKEEGKWWRGFDIVYTNTEPKIVTQRVKSTKKTDSGILRIGSLKRISSSGNIVEYTNWAQPLNGDISILIDPYDNLSLQHLEIRTRKFDLPEKTLIPREEIPFRERGRHELLIEIECPPIQPSVPSKHASLEYTLYDGSYLGISGYLEPLHKRLSEDHVKALFSLMDSFIPQTDKPLESREQTDIT